MRANHCNQASTEKRIDKAWVLSLAFIKKRIVNEINSN